MITALTPRAVLRMLEDLLQPEDRGDRPPDDTQELVVDLTGRRIMWRNQELRFTAQEFELLATLAVPPDRAVPFKELIAAVWGTERHGDAEILRSAIKRLRNKLAAAGVEVRIEAVPGFGFRLTRIAG